jgi:hypothetical protein
MESMERPLRRRVRQFGLLRLVPTLPFLASAAYGDTPTLRLGDLTLQPYLLLQLDEGGTFGQTAAGAKGSRFRPGYVVRWQSSAMLAFFDPFSPTA